MSDEARPRLFLHTFRKKGHTVDTVFQNIILQKIIRFGKYDYAYDKHHRYKDFQK